MNYMKHYQALCLGRQSLNREKSNEVYYENHHIVPKSLGGSDNTTNLVLLTADNRYFTGRKEVANA